MLSFLIFAPVCGGGEAGVAFENPIEVAQAVVAELHGYFKRCHLGSAEQQAGIFAFCVPEICRNRLARVFSERFDNNGRREVAHFIYVRRAACHVFRRAYLFEHVFKPLGAVDFLRELRAVYYRDKIRCGRAYYARRFFVSVADEPVYETCTRRKVCLLLGRERSRQRFLRLERFGIYPESRADFFKFFRRDADVHVYARKILDAAQLMNVAGAYHA